MSIIKRILLPVATSAGDLTTLKNKWGAPSGIFEQVGGVYYLRLLVDRPYYKPTFGYDNGEPKILRGMSGYHAEIKGYIRGFDARVIDERSFIYRIARQVAKTQTSSDFRLKTPITLLDYCLPEDEDEAAALAAGAEPFTARKGLIRLSAPEGGAAALDNRIAIKGGWTLHFEEVDWRFE
jgi:hypothetical protein